MAADGVPGDRSGAAGDELVVGAEVELDVGPVAHGGVCVARVGGPGGRVVFVRYALPGERAVVRITEARAGSYCRGEAVTILRADPRRIEAPCAHFRPGGCGGCDFQHAAPDLQRELKAAVVAEQLRRLAGLDVPVVVEGLPGGGFGWRTRVRWAMSGGGGDGNGGDGTIGPRRYRSHAVVPVSPEAPCLIAEPGLTEAAGRLRPPRGADQVVLARTVDGPPAVTWLRGGRALAQTPHRGQRSRSHRGGSPMLSGHADEFGLPGSKSGYPGGGDDGHASTGDLVESAAGRTFVVGAGGFWQAHARAADVLCDAVTEALVGVDLTGGTAWDLYGGVGLFAAVLADLVGPGGRVVSVEHDREASRLAALNLRGLPQALALRARVDAALKAAASDGSLRTPLTGPATPSRRPSPAAASLTTAPDGLAGPVDAVVLDPPRSGAGTRTCRAIAERGPAVIVYVACDPAALARDTGALVGAGFRLDTLRAFDAFPQTHHTECVARFVPA